MDKSRFSVGQKVICIATDGYCSDVFPVGSIFTVASITNPGTPEECLLFKDVINGPYSRKFEPLPEEFIMEASEYEDIIASQKVFAKIASA